VIRDLNRYPAYRDSGVAWLGEVPEHWQVQRIKTVFREKDERSGDGSGLLLSLTRAKGIVPQSEASNRIAGADDLSKYRVCQPGDLVMNRMQAWSGMFAVSPCEGLVSPDYSVFIVRGSAQAKYFEHLFKTPMLVDQFARRSKGIGSGFNRLYTPDFGAVPVAVPPIGEQTAIVRYLNHMDRRVRRYIRAKQKLIALLEEQKQAIIERAVTQGLDRSVRFKPSGIEGLGDVPEHWEVVRLKYLLHGQLANGIFKKKDSFGRGVPLVNVKDVYCDDFTVRADDLEPIDATASEISTFRARADDIFFVRSSLKLEGTGRSAMLAHCGGSAVFECHLVRARPRSSRVSPRYLALFLNCPSARDYLVSRANTVTMSTLPQGVLAAMEVVVPPLEEQERIVDVTDAGIRRITSAIESARGTIHLLLEYRTRLTADVVTGKLDVREAAAQLPDETYEAEAIDDVEALLEAGDLGEEGDLVAGPEEVGA